jgi:hypothetical protein
VLVGLVLAAAALTFFVVAVVLLLGTLQNELLLWETTLVLTIGAALSLFTGTVQRRRAGAAFRRWHSQLDKDDRARKRAEAALLEHEQFLQSVLNHNPCDVFWKAQRGVYFGCNAHNARDLGRASPAAVVGRTDHDLLPCKADDDFYVRCDREVTK